MRSPASLGPPARPYGDGAGWASGPVHSVEHSSGTSTSGSSLRTHAMTSLLHEGVITQTDFDRFKASVLELG